MFWVQAERLRRGAASAEAQSAGNEAVKHRGVYAEIDPLAKVGFPCNRKCRQ